MFNSQNFLANHYSFHKKTEPKENDFSFNFVSNISFENENISRRNYTRIMSRRNCARRIETCDSQQKIRKSIRFPTLQSKNNIQKTEEQKNFAIIIQPQQPQLKLCYQKNAESITIEELQEQKRAFCIKYYRRYQQQRLFQQLIIKNQSIKETIQTWVLAQHKVNEIKQIL